MMFEKGTELICYNNFPNLDIVVGEIIYVCYLLNDRVYFSRKIKNTQLKCVAEFSLHKITIRDYFCIKKDLRKMKLDKLNDLKL